MRKPIHIYLLLLFCFTSSVYANDNHGTHDNNDVKFGPPAEVILLTLTLAYSAINAVPSLVEYNRNKRETPFLIIFTGGFIGGLAGVALSEGLRRKTDGMNANWTLGLMFAGMVMGNRYAHYKYSTYKIKNVSLYPLVSEDNAGLGLSFDF